MKVIHFAKDGTRTEQEKEEGMSIGAALKETQQPSEAEKVEEQDDGMRFQCSTCQTYVKPDPEGSGMKCDECGEWFTLCEKCMPDVDAYSSDAVWLCPTCRR